MAGEGEPSLTEAPEYRIAVLFATFILITWLFEKLMGGVNGFLKKRNRRGLLHTIHKLEEELLALGLISLLLLAFEEYVVQICSYPKDGKKKLSKSHKKSDGDANHKKGDHHGDETEHSDEVEAVLSSEVEGLMTSDDHNLQEDMLPLVDDLEQATDATLAGDGHRRLLGAAMRVLLAGGGGGHEVCPEGKDSFWSIRILHETHIFIFLLAVSHIVFAAISMVLCSWKVSQWKKWEQDSEKELESVDFRRLVPGQSFYKLRVFFYQFWPHIGKSVYLGLRRLFIERMELSDDFDFHTFMVNCMEEGYSEVITLEWIMWLFALIWIETNVMVVYIMMGVSLFVTFVAGAKLQSIAVKLQNEAYSLYADVHESPKPNMLQRNLARISNRLTGGHAKPNPKTNQHGSDKNHSPKGPPSTDGTSTPEMGDQDSDLESATKERKVGCSAISFFSLVSDPAGTVKNVVQGFLESWGRLEWMADAEDRRKTFSPSYKAKDSASYFLFKRPQLMLRLFQYTFFMTSMVIAILTFNHWQEANPKLILTSLCWGIGLMIVGFIVMVLTSLLILPVYWLTMAVGSHCPSNVLKRARKAMVEPTIVSTLEKLSMNPKMALGSLAKTSMTAGRGLSLDATAVLAPILSEEMGMTTDGSMGDFTQEAGGKNMKTPREKTPEVPSSALGMLVGAMAETKARELQTLAHSDEESHPPSGLRRTSLAGGDCRGTGAPRCRPALANVSAPVGRVKVMNTGVREQETVGDVAARRKKPVVTFGGSVIEQMNSEPVRATETEAAAAEERCSKYKGFESKYDGELREARKDVDYTREYGVKHRSQRE